jgi:D-arabinose 1-dehydrogenase-like Zn-dependent alcohol dehydrogenase
MAVAAQIGLRATVEPFRLDEANVALERLRTGNLKGAAVLIAGSYGTPVAAPYGAP